MNKDRSLGSVVLLSKKKPSKRLNQLYSFDEKELGIVEVTKNYKRLLDAADRAKAPPSNTFTKMLALDIKLLLLGSPEGYVCRVTSTETYRYPSSFQTFINGIIPCLELCWLTKSITEETLGTLTVPTRVTITRKRRKSEEKEDLQLYQEDFERERIGTRNLRRRIST
ncbi:hypothetical protein K501DRAFT_278324 [Backusella circina FSU 941]|nr:hypothetical protein K501DRAFT_278324 [Backusella circina FSU 941]